MYNIKKNGKVIARTSDYIFYRFMNEKWSLWDRFWYWITGL